MPATLMRLGARMRAQPAAAWSRVEAASVRQGEQRAEEQRTGEQRARVEELPVEVRGALVAAVGRVTVVARALVAA